MEKGWASCDFVTFPLMVCSMTMPCLCLCCVHFSCCYSPLVMLQSFLWSACHQRPDNICAETSVGTSFKTLAKCMCDARWVSIGWRWYQNMPAWWAMVCECNNLWSVNVIYKYVVWTSILYVRVFHFNTVFVYIQYLIFNNDLSALCACNTGATAPCSTLSDIYIYVYVV